jgi:hypothetical protein
VKSTTALFLAFGLAFLRPASASSAEDSRPEATPAPARVYTNDDLDRMRPFRDELGARSVPAVTAGERESREPAGSALRARDSGKPSARDEAYWRREAEKLRERLRALADQRDELRARLSERRDDERRELRRNRSSRTPRGSSERALEARIAAIERRMRELEEDLVDRARRAGALPGWLR